LLDNVSANVQLLYDAMKVRFLREYKEQDAQSILLHLTKLMDDKLSIIEREKDKFIMKYYVEDLDRMRDGSTIILFDLIYQKLNAVAVPFELTAKEKEIKENRIRKFDEFGTISKLAKLIPHLPHRILEPLMSVFGTFHGFLKSKSDPISKSIKTPKEELKKSLANILPQQLTIEGVFTTGMADITLWYSILYFIIKTIQLITTKNMFKFDVSEYLSILDIESPEQIQDQEQIDFLPYYRKYQLKLSLKLKQFQSAFSDFLADRQHKTFPDYGTYFDEFFEFMYPYQSVNRYLLKVKNNPLNYQRQMSIRTSNVNDFHKIWDNSLISYGIPREELLDLYDPFMTTRFLLNGTDKEYYLILVSLLMFFVGLPQFPIVFLYFFK